MKTSAARRGLTLSDLGFVYGVLFALSLVLINPWGEPRGPIWTQPKVFVLTLLTLLTWGVLLVSGLVALWGWVRRRTLAPTPWVLPGGWVVGAVLWLLFLASGVLSALRSPVAFEIALSPHNEMGDGWVYWAWMAAFTLGNALLLKRYPALFRAQLYGLLVGGVLLSLAIFVQVYDWTFDFTATMGQTVGNPPVGLRSLTYRGWMPIGLMSNRGHAAFVVGALGILVLVSLVRGWLKGRYVWPLYAVFLAALYFTSTRGAQLAFAAGLLYLFIRFWRVKGARKTLLLAFAPLVLGVVLLQGVKLLTGVQTRALPPLETLGTDLNAFTSARSYLWPSAVDGIRERPLFGWGFNGYGLAWPYIVDFEERWKVKLPRDGAGNPIEVKELQVTDHYYFRYFGEDDKLHLAPVLTNKAHNIVLDTAVSLGLVGLGIYLLLFGFFTYATARGAGWGLEALAAVYFVFGLTWFESAQYSHLAWWALSVGLARYALPRPKTVPEAPGSGVLSAAPNS